MTKQFFVTAPYKVFITRSVMADSLEEALTKAAKGERGWALAGDLEDVVPYEPPVPTMVEIFEDNGTYAQFNLENGKWVDAKHTPEVKPKKKRKR